MSSSYILALDQGTTSTRAVVYDERGTSLGVAARELTQHYPRPDWVEHDPDEIWRSVAEVVPEALGRAGVPAGRLAGIGLTNQRETVVLWRRATLEVCGRAIVWQDRRTAAFCRDRRADAGWLRERTGLVLDPYFSASKLWWVFDQSPDLRREAEAGALAAGTVDSFLIARLTGGAVHATDVTNASRTMLLDIRRSGWDDELCRYFGVPAAVLPGLRPSSAEFGVTRGLDFLPDGLPIAGVAGDQQAALFGQAGFAAGEAKCTYGTGAFFLLHVGDTPTPSRHGLLTTLAATLDEKPKYALEGSVFIAGAAVQWLRDGLNLFPTSAAVEALAARSDPRQEVIFVPALVGLGAPHWSPEARGVVFGLTRGTTAADLARAALDGVAMQVVDLLAAAAPDAAAPLAALRVDGGMSRNAWFLQRQADVLGLPVLQAIETESTALGAAFLAGLRVGVWPNLDALRGLLRTSRRFEPGLAEPDRRAQLITWRRAVDAVLAFYRTAGPAG